MNPSANLETMHWAQRAFVEGGPIMYGILVVGILSLVLIVERTVQFSSLIVNRKEFLDGVFSMVLRGDIRQAIAYCDSKGAPLPNTVKAGLVQVLNRRPDEEVQVAMDAAVLRETPKLEGWTSFLAVFGNIAVLIGLLGTIVGMIASFRAVAAADPATKAEELSRGIAHALNCTGFGLFVAITSIVAYGYFQFRISRAENELVEASMNMMNVIVANREKLKE